MKNTILVHDRGRKHVVFVEHVASIQELDVGNYRSRILLDSGDSIHCTENIDSLAIEIDNKLT